MNDDCYVPFDFVFSGHTHVPHLRYVFDKETGRRTVFINLGLVGQPRNGNPFVQYAIVDVDTFSVSFKCVPCDVQSEQAYYS